MNGQLHIPAALTLWEGGCVAQAWTQRWLWETFLSLLGDKNGRLAYSESHIELSRLKINK
jgi:hypothetical protein